MGKLLRVSTLFQAATLSLLLLIGCSGNGSEEIGTAVTEPVNTPIALATVSVVQIEPAPSPAIIASAYPGPELNSFPTLTPRPDPYPAPTAEIREIDPTSATVSAVVFMPITGSSSTKRNENLPGVNPEVTLPPTPIPTIDFAAKQAELRANGADLGYVKIGFHVTLPEDKIGLDNWMKQLDQAGVPFFVKTVDNAEPLFRAQELMKVSGIPHTLVYRSTSGEPFYDLPAQQAAQIHWQEHRDKFPPELDTNLVWIETLNEPDQTRGDWWGQYALETARLAMAEGFNWAGFSWASGEPESELWQTPSMLEFLRLASENPDRLAIAIHEYSFLKEELDHQYPYKVGRFQELFRITDEQGLARPTLLITEWGWEHNNIPAPERAIKDIDWASRLYAPYPEVKGAGMWNLGIGCCFGDISEQVQEVIEPLINYSLTHYFEIPLPPDKQPINPEQFRP